MTSIYTMVVRCVGILVSTAATYYLAVRVISHANALGEKDKDFEEWRQAYDRACAVYCRGELLDAVQRLKLFRDSKSFVDMPMKLDPEDIMAAFRSLPRPLLPQTLSDFVAEHFLQPGSDVIPYPLPSPEIVGLNWIEELNGPAKSWAMDLIKKWAQLTRKTAPSVSKNPERTSTLHRRHVFVVPGGRFRESYYWDSYWIVKGLIISGLGSIAKGVVKNLLDDVHKFGFVPNGGRIYYATRSQPPLLCSMVREVYESSDDKEFLSSALRTLEIEYSFWMSPANSRVVAIPVPNINGVTVELNRYYSKDNTPRPESYREDLNTSESPHIFREIRSAAESGWDFSSRWILNKNQSGGYSLKDLAVTSLAPVDLNAFLYSMESSMSHLYSVLGNTHASGRFSKAAVRRKNAIMKVMAHGSPARFFDVDIKTGKPSPYSTAAEYTIMWAVLPILTLTLTSSPNPNPNPNPNP
ncbi:hypothetical protein AAMO2058_000172300 [Amorphochlora amoebiformis]